MRATKEAFNMTEHIFPVHIVGEELAENSQNLLKKQTLQIGLAETCISTFEKDGYVILDYGKEMCGSVRILTFQSESAQVRIRFGESLTECCSELGGAQNATNDHSLRDFTVELPFYSDMTFGNTGFRFVRLDFLGRVTLKSVVAVNHILNQTPRFRYEGPDEQIRTIYDVAKRTVDLCTSSGFVWDGIKRDRLVWIGDMHPEMMALTTLYGRVSAIERSLDFAKKQAPLPGWMNGFPMYSMWWIIIVAEYYEKTGATAFTRKQIAYLEGLVHQMNGFVNEKGEMSYPFYFLDWPTHEKPDELHGVRALNIMAVKKAALLLREFGKDPSVAEGMLARLLKIEIEPEQSKQVLGLKFFATKLSDEEKARLVDGGAKGMSSFMSYYIIKAVASFDRDAAIRMMKEFYGAMLDKGATTFWENFDMDWVENTNRIDEFPKEGQKDIHGDFGIYCYTGLRHSLCHGWSAGVLQFIQEECN
ncbi:MAG: alpha-L-rhamnosidase [Ruminococcaceae bacterium]|nr:alpha-L-rhamnosidase [Oscillospiraceae bacterium]